MDQRVEKAFVSLLQTGLWGATVDVFEIFALSYSEWFSLYRLAKDQTVEGLVFDAIIRLPGQYQAPKELMLKWLVRVDAIERENIKKNKITLEISTFLKTHHIDAILLKGSSLAVYYTKPLLRLSGDVDLYFEDPDIFNRANQLIKQRGVYIGAGALSSTFYKWKGCEIEHHSKLTDIVNPLCESYLRKLEKQETNNKISINLNEEGIRTPSLLMTHIQVNAHILKHFMGFGIGLRQFCDVARLYYHTSKSLNGEELKLIYKKLGICRWMELIHCFLVDQLGLDAEFLPYQIQWHEDSQWLMTDVLTVGNFGFQGHQKKNKLYPAVLSRLIKAQKYAPYEAFWFPISKMRSSLSRMRQI